MQRIFTLSQVEKESFETLAQAGGQQAAFQALLVYKGITNAALAHALGITPSFASKLRKGRKVTRPCILRLKLLEVPEALLPRADVLSIPEAA